MRRILPTTAVLLLLLAPSAASSASSPTAFRQLRGASNTKGIRGASKHNNPARFLQDEEDVTITTSSDSKSGKLADFRDVNEKQLGNAQETRTESVSGSRKRKDTHAGGSLRDRNEKKTRNQKKTLPTIAPVTPILSPDEAILEEGAAIFLSQPPSSGPTESLTPSPTAFPTRRPTPIPTWTFEAIPKVVETHVEEVCEYCQGCYFSTNIVYYEHGARATCAHVMEVAPTLTHYQCNVDRKLIEDSCCCRPQPEPPLVAETRTETTESAVDACDVCSGKEFLPENIITFSIGKTVTCEGFQDIVLQSGMPRDLCRKERKAIETACCPSNTVVSEPIVVSPPPVQKRLEGSSEDSGDMSPRVENDSCSFCAGKDLLKDRIIQFSRGISVSCGGLEEVVRAGLADADPGFCKKHQTRIEETCCKDIAKPIEGVSESSAADDGADGAAVPEPISEPSVVNTEPIAINPPVESRTEDYGACTFCVGQEFLKIPTIHFSSRNDSVSCAGLKDLIEMGLPEIFCQMEGRIIEETCCKPLARPTIRPTFAPTPEPTPLPTAISSSAPSDEPSAGATNAPTEAPLGGFSGAPSDEPTTQSITEPPTAEPFMEPIAPPITEEIAEPISLPITEPEPVTNSIPVSLTDGPTPAVPAEEKTTNISQPVTGSSPVSLTAGPTPAISPGDQLGETEFDRPGVIGDGDDPAVDVLIEVAAVQEDIIEVAAVQPITTPESRAELDTDETSTNKSTGLFKDPPTSRLVEPRYTPSQSQRLDDIRNTILSNTVDKIRAYTGGIHRGKAKVVASF